MSANQPINQFLNRRHFLKFISLGFFSTSFSLTACTHKKFYNPDQDIILGGGRFKQNDKLRHVLAIANLQQKETQLIDLDFLAHGIIIDPNNKKRLLSFEKNGRFAVEINLDQNLVTKKIPVVNNKIFSGHGAFNKTGEILYTAEMHTDNRQGFISIRDGGNFETISEISSFGNNPHDCQLIDDGATLVVSNAGDVNIKNARPSVVYINTKTQKLVERIILGNQQLNAGHIGIADNGNLIISSAPHSNTINKATIGGVSIRSNNQSVLSMTQPEAVIKQMKGEALSIAIDNKHNIAAVTHPDANLVTFWSIEKKALVKAMSVPKPQGITMTLDEKNFIISYANNSSIVQIGTQNLIANANSIMQPSYISGEHIYNWSKILTQIMPTNIY